MDVKILSIWTVFVCRPCYAVFAYLAKKKKTVHAKNAILTVLYDEKDAVS